MTYKLSKSKKVVCGFYEEKSHKIVPITNCMIQSDKATAIIDGINKALTKNKIEPYDEKTGRGVVRHVVIRIGEYTNEIMVSLVTNGEMFPGRKNVINDILKQNLSHQLNIIPTYMVIKHFHKMNKYSLLSEQ